jgi:flagellar basal body-associated protein FliL
MIDGGPYTTYGKNGSTIKPFGVDIQKKQNRGDLGKGFIVIIAVSVFVAVVLCTAAVWFMFKFRVHVSQRASIPRPSPPSLTKASGNTTR